MSLKRERESERESPGHSHSFHYYNTKQYNTIASHHTLTPIYCLCLCACEIKKFLSCENVIAEVISYAWQRGLPLSYLSYYIFPSGCSLPEPLSDWPSRCILWSQPLINNLWKQKALNIKYGFPCWLMNTNSWAHDFWHRDDSSERETSMCVSVNIML